LTFCTKLTTQINYASLMKNPIQNHSLIFYPQISYSPVNMDQQYVLRWNKHHENLSDGVISYFERGLMCDVTITVGPRQKLKVRYKQFSLYFFLHMLASAKFNY
jgi:hypothetical protein